MKMVFTLLISVALIGLGSVQAQEVSIELGFGEIAENQAWTITVTISNARIQGVEGFPDIQGFQKRGTSSSSNTQIINGQVSSSQSLIMTYIPLRQGQFRVPAFTLTVNGKSISSPGTSIKVGPPVQRQRSRDPFRSLFDTDPFGRSSEPTEFVDVQDEAFLALSLNKNEIFVGEGVTATLSFFVAESNRAPLQFFELGKQLSSILKEIRPQNCWEENFNIENITGERLVLNNKNYTQYKIYQGAFYPLNAEDINFPQVGLEMIKYKVAKNPSFFGSNRKEDFKTFYSKPKTVKVKPLPPHPLKGVVAVGDYYLNEDINTNQIATGESFSYDFNIYGEGNVSAVNKPEVINDETFDFYEPNIVQNITRRGGRVTGSKSFSYFGIPKEPGTYQLKDYFQWIYFNPKKEKYDTLKSTKSIMVTGESKKNESIQSRNFGSFYDQISFTDNSLRDIDNVGGVKLFANLLILTMLVSSVVLFFRK